MIKGKKEEEELHFHWFLLLMVIQHGPPNKKLSIANCLSGEVGEIKIGGKN